MRRVVERRVVTVVERRVVERRSVVSVAERSYPYKRLEVQELSQ